MKMDDWIAGLLDCWNGDGRAANPSIIVDATFGVRCSMFDVPLNSQLSTFNPL
jgi:hypothetical protein